MKRYLIERNITGVGQLDTQQLKAAAETSNAELFEYKVVIANPEDEAIQ